MTTRREFLILPALLALPGISGAAASYVVFGSYPLEHMRAIPHLTFPRVLLYDRAGKLVDKTKWPRVLSGIKNSAGDAFCCVSEGPALSGSAAPPPNCETIVYGVDINEHFQGLVDRGGRPIARARVPPHNYLIVEYYASWCSACITSRRALDAFMASPQSRGFASLLVDFSALQG